MDRVQASSNSLVLPFQIADARALKKTSNLRMN